MFCCFFFLLFKVPSITSKAHDKDRQSKIQNKKNVLLLQMVEERIIDISWHPSVCYLSLCCFGVAFFTTTSRNKLIIRYINLVLYILSILFLFFFIVVDIVVGVVVFGVFGCSVFFFFFVLLVLNGWSFALDVHTVKHNNKKKVHTNTTTKSNR